MKSTREVILQTLLTKNRCTISELAEEVGINPISVRHHIAKLEAENLLSSEEERRGVGRPRRVYFLTEKGLETFPSHYIHITNRLIQQIKRSLASHGARPFFSEMGKNIVHEQISSQVLEQMSIEERLSQLQRILTEEGISISWKDSRNQIQLSVDQCPYYQVALAHKEVCSIDTSIIAETLRITPQFMQCILDGKDHCVYLIPKQGNYHEE